LRGVPAGLEALEHPPVDLRGDVGVGLVDPVLEVVPEPACLGDLRDAVRDEPGLLAVRKPMERQSRPDRVEQDPGLREVPGAVRGGAQDPPVDVATPEPPPCGPKNTGIPSVAARCSRRSRIKNGGSVMIRIDADVFGGPSHSRGPLSCRAPTYRSTVR
jgi:hypothetical protein